MQQSPEQRRQVRGDKAGPVEQRNGRWTPDSVHLTQFRSKYNPNGPSRSENCVPTSVLMALRLAGLDAPGYDGQRNNNAIRKLRHIAAGPNSESGGMTSTDTLQMVRAAGGKATRTKNFAQITEAAQAGKPIVLTGNPSQAWNKRYARSQISPYDCNHAVTVSGYNAQSGKYIVNDPLSRIGPIEVSAPELRTFFNGASSGGTGVIVSS